MRKQRNHKMIVILACFIIASFDSLWSQTVIRVQNGYVLFDSAEGAGKIGETVKVKRRTDAGNVETGSVKLLLFRDGKASGKIVGEPQPMAVQNGDFISHEIVPKTDSVQATPMQKLADACRTVVKVISGYALVDLGTERWKTDTVLRVQRGNGAGMAEVGEMKLLKYENGKAAAKIVRENEPYRILPGDVVFQKEKELDIDTYFFEGY